MTFQIVKPFDAHLHLRTGEMARLVTPMSTKQYSDVIIMPNLQNPVDSISKALEYRFFLSTISECNYHMALYLTENTTLEEIQKVKNESNIIGFKLYPLNVTTGSSSGVSDIKKIYHLFEEMQKLDVPLLIHGEVNRANVDIYDKEKKFIDETLIDIVNKFPQLKITLEHITTSDAVDFVKESPSNLVATITAHHLLINRTDIFTVNGNPGLNPHNYCLPIAKREKHRLALVEAAISGNPKFFAGTDSAPHTKDKKESDCGCAGCFTGLHSVELYTTVFDKEKKLDSLELFLSLYGRKHYGITIPDEYLTVNNVNFNIPDYIGNEKLTPFMASKDLNWHVYYND